ncbi:MAG: NAD-dependent epimerase/dehydratase family protein [Candidatus Micrarchaeota archaeon]|nr:NAD-dependent epimerase/dehydratase family protein [Candidatus Micrarchaeota archaeon]
MIVVTGGAGFIGSHLVDSLISLGNDVTIIDNLSSSSMEYVNKKAKFILMDIRDKKLSETLISCETVFHFAADPNVRTSAEKTTQVYENNVYGTFNLLEACRIADVKRIIFASTSAVYGLPKQIPTPETHPLYPVSNYGASKVFGEAYCSSYFNTYGLRCAVLRLANIIGERSTHGVIFDFYNKLKANNKVLEILGNGKQSKSYLYIKDCIGAILCIYKLNFDYEVFNIGSETKIEVNEIAKIVCNTLNVSPKFHYTSNLPIG